MRAQFHTSQRLLAFKKKASAESTTGSVFKRGTPNADKGWIYNFKETSAYSGLGRNAADLKDGPGSTFMDVGNLAANTIVRYPSTAAKALGVFGSFKRGQQHELFKNKTTLVRERPSLALRELIARGKETASRENRACLTGELGVGKSTGLAQAQAFALLEGYVVVPVPRANELVSGENDAVFHAGTQLFTQPMYVKQWMKRIASGNKALLSAIPLTQKDYHLPPRKTGGPVVTPKNLYELLMEGRMRKNIHDVMDTFMHELSVQTAAPVLFTMDDVNVFTERIYSANVDVHNNRIYHGKLQVPSYFLTFLSGEKSFVRGAVMTALSGSHRVNETITVGLGLQDSATPYAHPERYDELLSSKFRGVQPIEVPRYTLHELRNLLAFYKQAELIPRDELTTDFVDQKYVLSGNGNARALLKTCTSFLYQ
ncbi:small ribosomal subunit protein mS29 [Trichomonascus vanleenenianus]|uniref:mitochondrial 37S ribosomal protein mS29 RSM23 n=1 Tax=Trichomonascus vanleenenianus TaxID=2268995 RepID=UPI003EC95E4C